MDWNGDVFVLAVVLLGIPLVPVLSGISLLLGARRRRLAVLVACLATLWGWCSLAGHFIAWRHFRKLAVAGHARDYVFDTVASERDSLIGGCLAALLTIAATYCLLHIVRRQ